MYCICVPNIDVGLMYVMSWPMSYFNNDIYFIRMSLKDKDLSHMHMYLKCQTKSRLHIVRAKSFLKCLRLAHTVMLR